MTLIKKILQFDEWDKFECKRANCRPAKVLETMCAMANAGGGLFVYGLEDPKKGSGNDRLYGISQHLDNVSELKNLLSKEFTVPLDYKLSEEDILNRNKKDDHLLLIYVNKSSTVISLKKGDTYIRSGHHNHKMTAQEIMRLNYEKGDYKYETELSDCNLDSLDQALVTEYMKENKSGNTTLQFLKDNGLAKDIKTKTKLTKGCVLLFGTNPAISLHHKCSIKISRYHGTIEVFSEAPNLVEKPITIEGPLIKQIEKAATKFDEIMKSSTIVGDEKGLFRSKMKIPRWVYNEAVTNAVIHRNYSVPNDIQVRFFDDRIEVESPGAYPGHITVGNIRDERYARNPNILRTLNRFTHAPNIDIGEGVNRMFKLMKANNLYHPLYLPERYRPNSVQVILLNMARIKHWDVVSNYLDEKSSIKSSEARKITGIKDSLKMSRLFRDWVDKKLIIRIGEKKGSYYVKPGKELP